jgi:hypothetical protein
VGDVHRLGGLGGQFGCEPDGLCRDLGPDSALAVSLRSAQARVGGTRRRREVPCAAVPRSWRRARVYDDRLGAGGPSDPKNPAPIISRRRDGLNPAHPFVQALREAAEVPLATLIAEEADRARRDAGNIESDQTRSALDRLARELSRIIGDELRDIEAEELPDTGEGQAPLLVIVPEQAIAYMGEDRTLTVAARADDVAEGDIVQVSTDPTGVVEVLTTAVPLKPHARREDILVGQIRVRPLIEDESTIITAELGDRKADALIEVRSERVIVEDEIETPETLKFERASYRVGWQHEKSLVLLAPSELVEAKGTRVRVSSSDPGVVVRTPSVQLSPDGEHGFYRGSVRIEARTLNATSVVTARLDDVAATALVAVTRREEGLNYRVRLVDEDYGINRAIIETEPAGDGREIRVIKIAGRHPALRPYLQEGFVGQNTPICRGLFSEIVADATARVVVSELYRLRRGTEVFDVDRFYREHYKRLSKFLPRFQRILVGDPAVALQAERLAPVPCSRRRRPRVLFVLSFSPATKTGGPEGPPVRPCLRSPSRRPSVRRLCVWTAATATRGSASSQPAVVTPPGSVAAATSSSSNEPGRDGERGVGSSRPATPGSTATAPC